MELLRETLSSRGPEHCCIYGDGLLVLVRFEIRRLFDPGIG